MWIEYLNNPFGLRVGDCVIRAISKALNQSWEKTYIDLAYREPRHFDTADSNRLDNIADSKPLFNSPFQNNTRVFLSHSAKRHNKIRQSPKLREFLYQSQKRLLDGLGKNLLLNSSLGNLLLCVV